jgi:HEAT repeat protein
MFISSLILALALSAAGAPSADDALTKADIPAGLSPELGKLIEQTFSDDPEQQRNACKGLEEMGPRAAPAVPFLIRLIGDRSLGFSVWSAAGSAMKKIGPSAVDACIAALHRASGDRLRALIRQLGEFDDPRAVRELASLLYNRDEVVRADAALSLRFSPALNREPNVIPVLIQQLATDKNEDVRLWAAAALGQSRDPRVVDPLTRALTDSDWHVRSFAATALGRVGDRRAVPALIDLLKDAQQHKWARIDAAKALGQIGDPRAIESLHAVLRDGKDYNQFRRAALYAIAEIDGAKAVPLLTPFAKAEAENERIRYRAAMCIVKVTDGAINDVAVVAALRLGYSSRVTADDSDGLGGDPDDWVAKQKVRAYFDKVAKRGQSFLVRSIAARMRDGGLTEPLGYYLVRGFLALVGIYLVILIVAGVLTCRSYLKRGKLLRRWLFVIISLIALGIVLMLINWRISWSDWLY